jgi:phenylalanyl-tRNA synthetase beta chain
MLLSDEHKGIIEVDQNHAVGTPMSDIFGLNDAVIEINVTPNRIDCASVYGIARDLAAAGLGRLKPMPKPEINSAFKCPVSVKIDDESSPHFMGRMIKGVKNGPSPEWLQAYLKSVGQKSISALVDITNFLSLDLCRPLHVYDAGKLKGGIIVRQSRAGETLAALNEKTYELPDGAIAICDDSGVIGLGGIIGGASTGCDANTVDVFLESAYFMPERIAKTGRQLAINSDARYRFERGIDPESTALGIDIATNMILEICGGTASEVVEAGAPVKWQRTINYDPALLQKLIGVDLPAAQQKSILESLGFNVEGAGPFTVQPPSWRGDIGGAADLTEEIIRIYGFEHIPSVSVRCAETVPEAAETPLMARQRLARTALAARGFMDCITWSFLPGAQAELFGLTDAALKNAMTLKNPISSDMDVMRPSILPNLITAAQRNHDRGFGNVALAETGPIFKSVKPDGQVMVASGLRIGQNAPRSWADSASARGVDAFDAKADALAVLSACGAPAAGAQITADAPSYYHPGRSGALRLGPTVLAYFGEIHPAILEAMDVTQQAVGFEVFLSQLPAAKGKKGTTIPLLKLESLQPLARDFAFIVRTQTPAEDIVKAAKASDKTLIREAGIFDVYSGKGVEDGHKSVAFTVMLQPVDKTLTDQDLEALSAKIIENVIKKTGGKLRG